jgi:hypothetical protein
MGDEEFLDALEADNRAGNNEPEAPEPKPEPAKAEEPKAEPKADEPNRDEAGRFKAKEEAPAEPPAQPQPAEPVAAQPTPEAPKQPDPGFVPLTAVLDERERRQKLEAELERLKAAQPQPQVEVPDPDRDPVGFAQFQQTEFQKILLNERLNVSERFARKEHGAEALEAAKGWAKEKFASDPLYRQQIFADADPYDRLITDYRREQLFSQVSDPKEIEEFRAWKAAQSALAQPQTPGQPAPASSPPQAPSIPTPSLASAPSAGNVLQEPVQTDEDIFAETFARK